MDYQTPRNVRRESRTITGRTRGGKLNPVMATAVRGSEGGMLQQTVTLELDPIMGRMITPITAELTSVFVPVQAMDALLNPTGDYAGLTEVVREKLLTGNPLFGLEAEGEISKRCGVVPRRIGGVAQVSSTVRLAHNCAVNHLRLSKYHKAPTLSHLNASVSPAILGQTVLDRLNGVLDPDDHINGSVVLDLPSVNLPAADLPVSAPGYYNPSSWYAPASTIAPSIVGTKRQWADITAHMNAAVLSSGGTTAVSLVDFYQAEKMDALTRTMATILEENPQYGEEMVLRWAHGLSVDTGKTPFVVAQKQVVFGRSLVGATDQAGVQADTMRSDMMAQLSFSVPIPRTELGGIIISFIVVKPDETLAAQPHPFLSDNWGLDKFVADELALAPEAVTIRELDGDCAQALETTVAMFTGLNELKRTYVNYGFARNLDPTTVEAKTAIWQLEIPISVTPENILYPADLDHYPFADQLAEVVTYTIQSNLTAQTPIIFGPSPVEKLPVIGANDLFAETV